MEILTFKEFFTTNIRRYKKYEIHIVTKPFGQQIFCNIDEIKRAAKVALLHGSCPRVLFITNELKQRYGMESIKLEELSHLWK